MARGLLASIFLLSGIGKITAYAGTQGYMESHGIPGILLPMVITLEIVGALLLIVGWKARYSALVLAAFTIASAFVFHFDFGNTTQYYMFMKNLAIAGGLLLIYSHGVSSLSLEAESH